MENNVSQSAVTDTQVSEVGADVTYTVPKSLDWPEYMARPRRRNSVKSLPEISAKEAAKN